MSWIGLREGHLHKKFDGDASEYIYGRRVSIGGPAPIEVGRMADDRLRKVEDTEKRRTDRLAGYEKAQQRLEKAIDNLLE